MTGHFCLLKKKKKKKKKVWFTDLQSQLLDVNFWRMEGFEEYVAVYDFKSDADSEVELVVNDVVEVVTGHVVNKDPSGWVKGTNKRTGVEGFYPGKLNISPVDVCM